MRNYEVGSSLPQSGTKLRVIGAGLPRSGTNSFCAAVSTLLDGPAYHAAAQCALSPTSKNVLALIHILRLKAREGDLINAQEQKTARRKTQELKHALATETDGWIATADAPLCLLVPELLSLYPDAVVVCTTRDREKWAKSMWKVAQLGNPPLLSWLYFWIPVLRHSPTMWGLQNPLWRHLYGTGVDSEADARRVWDRHHEWLREVVPPDKLFFADVKDGWEPICRALQLPVPPDDVPFPRLNDGEALEKTMRGFAITGVLRWCGVLVVFLLLAVTVWIRFG